MLLLAVAMLSAGQFRLALDYEWPGPTSMLLVRHDSAAQGGAIGAQALRDWDGGAIVDARGLYAVRGPVNVFYRIDASNEGWPDPSGGGKYEVCHTPSFNPLVDWDGGESPDWNGTNYLLDVSDGSSHTLAVVFGYTVAGRLLVRTTNGYGYTSINVDGLSTEVGQAYCTSVEWTPVGYGHCGVTVRHDSCALTPVPMCGATTVIASNGDAYCPGAPAGAWLGNRFSETAPTTTHIGALRVSEPE